MAIVSQTTSRRQMKTTSLQGLIFHTKTNSSKDLKANLTRPQLCSRPWILNKSLCFFLGINMQGDSFGNNTVLSQIRSCGLSITPLIHFCPGRAGGLRSSAWPSDSYGVDQDVSTLKRSETARFGEQINFTLKLLIETNSGNAKSNQKLAWLILSF